MKRRESEDMEFQVRHIDYPMQVPDGNVRDLAQIVAKEIERRLKGQRPDWHCADVELLSMGWTVEVVQ